jgi:predicted anti-sigma-YlaC factor YlaD
MFCDEVLDAIEPIAGGEMTPEGRVAAHLGSCPNCAQALEDARRIERALQMRAVPKPSAQFTARTVARLRRERWRKEQFVDAGFNIALAILVLGVAIVVWLFLNRSGLTAVGTDAIDLVAGQFVAVAHRVVPAVPVYLGATGLLLSALVVWWWAERGATP